MTIYVVIYEPDWNKLKKTLLSVLYQKHINYEIVISDDGSEHDCFDNIKELFNKYGFENYKLVKFEQNQGTVKNVANAVFNGSGIYARGLSPGDMLSSPTQLSSWFNWFECNNHFVGFGDCIYFSNEDDYKEHLIKNSPICKWLYKQNNQIAKARIDYLVLNDYIGGASFMFNRDIFLFYIQNIVDKVKYAEDNVFRIMMFDGIIPVYYEEHVTFYEYGSGISTSCNGKWKKLLQKDKQEANRVIMGREAWDYLSYRYKIWLNIENRSLKENIVTRGIKYFLFPSSLFIKLKGNLQPVYTMNSLDSEKSYYDFVSNL